MNIARVLYPVEVLGPGKRLGIWMCGCKHHCPGCSNPELWEPQQQYEIDIESFIRVLDNVFCEQQIDGIVLTGGDPFFQAKDLSILLPRLRKYSDDVLLYTGFYYEALLSSQSSDIMTCLDNISVLIDGPYIESLNNGALLRGSSNQRIIYLDSSVEPKYKTYLEEMKTNRIQNFSTSDGMISVGIHRVDFQRDIIDEAKKRGVVING